MEEIAQLEPYPRDLIVAHTVELLCIRQMDEHQAGVIFEMPGLENTGNGELLEARQDACRRYLPLRRDQYDLVPGENTQCPRQFPADDHAEAPWHQVAEFSIHHHPGKVSHLVFHFRQNASYRDATDDLVV